MAKYFSAVSSAFIVGLGQIINEKTEKGLTLLLIFYFGFPLLLYVMLIGASGRVFLWSLGISILSMFALWLYSIMDALRTNT
ncbi:MAG: hypothetical protein HQ564_06535 [Candidatus Saganbacteria bacterium]|nr:hypothetical protein [Candidatus Saganbacteria bacterium]